MPPRFDRWLDQLAPWGPRLVVVAATIVAAAMFAGVFRGEPAGDDLTFHLAEATRLADCLRAGDLDWWNPGANAGYPSAYYYQVLPQLAPAALAALTGTEVLPWFQLGLFVPLVLAPLAAYRALRTLQAAPWSAAGGALALLVCAGASRWGQGADGTFSVGLYTQTWAFAALPLALAHAARWIDGDRHLVAALAWGLFVGLCHPFAGIALGVGLGAAVLVMTLGAAARAIDAAQGGGGATLVRRVRAGWDRLIPGWRDPAQPPAMAAAPPPRIGGRIGRLVLLGLLLVIGALPAWLPVLVDYAAFGGFPHRVPDEVGPGFGGLWAWLTSGTLLDHGAHHGRWRVLSLLLPLALLAGRGRALPWLWIAATAFAALLGLGPHLVTADDLLPAVRFLGPLQICLALAIGVGVADLLARLWRLAGARGGGLVPRTALAAGAGVLVVLALVPALRLQQARVRVSSDYPGIHRDEIQAVIDVLRLEPSGRKQARAGTENHWFNQLPYVHARREALLQMGGAALQSSPNYAFLWQERDPLRTAWIYDAPYLTFSSNNADKMPDGEPVLTTPTFTVRRLPAPGLASPVEVTGTLPPGRFAARKAALAWLAGAEPMRDHVLAYAGAGGLTSPPAATVRGATRLPPGAGPDLRAEVDATAPTTIMFRESWHPRWRVHGNGVQLPVRRVSPDFFAVDVPAGTTVLTAEFARPWWLWGAYLALAMVLLAGWLIQRAQW
ncbi:MAG: hypothetical protein KA190_21995 [Kofleriaceae bacterium]|nr:hypothetical protein [Kofleriaceae bacterium]